MIPAFPNRYIDVLVVMLAAAFVVSAAWHLLSCSTHWTRSERRARP